MKAALALALPFAVGCACATNANCAVNAFQQVAGYITSKIPLNTQSACAGASSVPLQVDPQDVELPLAGACGEDPTDGACVACLRVACCAEVNAACVAGASSAAACATLPEVKNCILDAAAGNCAAACSPDGGAS